jgi:membrane-associated phospholipid phosphatase
LSIEDTKQKEHAISCTNWSYNIVRFCLVCLLVLCGYYFLDTRLAELVLRIIGSEFVFSEDVSHIPDLVLVTVCTATVLGWTGHLYLAKTNPRLAGPDFFEFMGCSVPLAFSLKFIFKFIVGRTNTRLWLVNPEMYGIHWFHGGGDFTGFPSGHMAVFTALLLAISRYYPQVRHLCTATLFVLGTALIATEYHFFSDVVAGAYLGLIVDQLTGKALSFAYRTA